MDSGENNNICLKIKEIKNTGLKNRMHDENMNVKTLKTILPRASKYLVTMFLTSATYSSKLQPLLCYCPANKKYLSP